MTRGRSTHVQWKSNRLRLHLKGGRVAHLTYAEARTLTIDFGLSYSTVCKIARGMGVSVGVKA